MKIFLIILLSLLGLLFAISLIRISLSISYTDTLVVDIRVCGIEISRLYKKKKTKKKTKTAKTGEAEGGKKKKSLGMSLSELLEIVNKFCTKFFGHVRVKVALLKIIVATDDPAKTAVRYGAYVQTVAYITEILKRKTKFGLTRNSDIEIRPDFCSTKTVAQIDIKLSVSVGGAIHSLIHAAIGYVKAKM